MSGVFKTILIMSVSGGLIALALFALKPLVKNRLPKSAQYYLWLVVLAALLVPVSGLFALPVGLNPMYATKAMLEPTVEVPFASAMLAPQEAIGDALNGGLGTITMYLEPLSDGTQATTEFFHSQVWVAFGSYAWGFGFAAALLYYLIGYAVFTRRHRRGNGEARPEELAALAELCGGKRTPLLYRNPLAATPMLIGVFRPAIVLPDRGYTDAQLRAVLLHELTHLRRGDVLVKWLSVFACAVHWFNPIVWLTRREIDRACELSCDEAVIRNLDADGKRNYGETLLYVAADAKTPRAVLSTTMCEEKKALKERLGAILRSRKHTRWAVALSVVLMVAVSGTALALGAGRTEGEGLIEMKMVYRDNPAFFLKDMNLLWGDTVYYETQVNNPERGSEIGYAVDEYSTWRIYELKGFGQDYVMAVESADVWRVMSSHAPEKPWRQYILENATDRQRVERMLSVSLYADGTAILATSLISSYMLLSPYYYTFAEGELLIHYENGNMIAKFTVVDDNTLVFKEFFVPLYADEGARYVVRYDDVDEFIANNPPYPAENDGNASVADVVYLRNVANSLQESIKPYEHLGISVDAENALMMYKGQPVREIFDPVAGLFIAETLGADGFSGRTISGAIDLTVVYENGKPAGFTVSTQDAYDARTEERERGAIHRVSDSEYEKHGISWDSENRMLFDGKLVRYFWDGFNVDANSTATHYDYLNEDGVVDVHTVRSVIDNGDGSINPFGELLDIVAYSQQEFDARDIKDMLSPPQSAASSDESGGMTMPSANGQTAVQADASSGQMNPNELAKQYAVYEPFGVTYDKVKDRFYFDGKMVRRFLDIKISNGESFSSGKFRGTMMSRYDEDGEIDIEASRDFTVLDENGYGKLTGVRISESE